MESIQITGFIGKVETKQANNKTITKFSVAVKHWYKDTDNQWKDYTEWWNCTLFGEKKGLEKGKWCVVVGDVKRKTYDSKNYAEIRVNSIEFPPEKKSNEEPF